MKIKRYLLCFLISITLPFYAQAAPPPPKISHAPVEKIDLNKVDLAHLIGSFKGIGAKRAESILLYREQHKGFKSIEELAEVKGLGARFVAKNRARLNERFIIH